MAIHAAANIAQAVENFRERGYARLGGIILNKRDVPREEEKVLEYAENCEDFTKNDVVSLLKVSASTAARVIRGLVEKNFLKRNGKARSTYYTLQKY